MAEEERYKYGTGRRKSAVARVRLYPGNGNFTINDKEIPDYFGGRSIHEFAVREPLAATNSLGRFDVVAKVVGGGVSGQAGAVRHGIARALADADDELRATLKSGGFLTRDARVKERKKVGLKRARKAPQYTKR